MSKRKLSDYAKSESKFLKAEDFPVGKQTPLVIDRLEFEEVQRDEVKEEKAVCYFSGKQKALVLNVTSTRLLVDAFGDDPDDCAGKEVWLRCEMVSYKGKMVPGLRLVIPAESITEDEVPF